jgi:Putative peptidoglycan binding domain
LLPRNARLAGASACLTCLVKINSVSMRKVLSAAVAAALVLLTIASAQQNQKKTAATGARKRPAATKAASSKGTASRKAAKRPAATWRNRQVAPSPDRYREIQNALAARGYLSPEQANGTWNQTSIDALKKFQTEQNLESTGKINSLSLIALGLGPKHDSPAAIPPPGQ